MKAKFFLLLPCAAIFGCGSEREPDETYSYGPKQGSVIAAARANGVDERALLAAAFTQSNFGSELESVGRIPGSTRITPFGLYGNAAPGTAPDDLAANASSVAKSMRTRANESHPSHQFDWMLIAAETIVGARDDSPATQTQTKVVLNELIASYNQGFSTALPGGEIVTVPPASSPIIPEKLDTIRRRLMDITPQRTEFGTFLQGNLESEEYGEKALTEMPKVNLRWCAASAIVCLDYLRLTKDSSAHFMAYRSAEGGLQFVQLHSIKKDLKWSSGSAANTVSIVLTGLAGNKTNWRPDWLTWQDYVSLQKTTLGILKSFSTFLPPGSMSKNPIDHVREEKTQVAAALPPSPVGETQTNFTLPPFWDMALFADILKVENPEIESQISTSSDGVINTFPDTRASFDISTSKLVSQLSFYSDIKGTSENPSSWELIRRSSLKDGTQSYRLEEEFAERGLSNNEYRSVRIVARNKEGKPVGFKILTFRAMGLR